MNSRLDDEDTPICSCWTTAGAASPLDADQRSPVSFAARVSIALDVGFAGFGITHADVVHLEETIGLGEATSILQDKGIRFVELEMLMEWFTTGPARESSHRIRPDLLAAAAILSVRHIKVGSTHDPSDLPPPSSPRNSRTFRIRWRTSIRG